jgi:hypothetical protein
MGTEQENKPQDMTAGDTSRVENPQFSASNYPATQESNPSNNPTKQSQSNLSAIPQDTVAKLVEKARKEEKDKVYSTIEQLKVTKTEGEAKAAELTEKLKAAQEEAEGLRTGKLQEIDSVNRELRELRETNKKLEKAIELVASESVARLEQAKLETFREKEIRKAGIKSLAKYVSGTDQDEILASIKQIKAEEEAIYESARKDVRKEITSELPTPIAPSGATGRGPNNALHPEQKEGIARLKGEAYLKEKQRLLMEARQKAGLA